MGLILDTSVLIAAERQKFNVVDFLLSQSVTTVRLAATALSRDYTLATLNLNEFKRIPGLKWAEVAAFQS